MWYPSTDKAAKFSGQFSLFRTGSKLKNIVGGCRTPIYRQISFKPNLPANRTVLEFHQEYNVDEHD